MDKETRSLLKASLEKARAKLKAAQDLLKQKNFDDSVSRAYYAVFHAAQAVLLTEGLHSNTHQGLVNLFGLHFAKAGKVDKRFGKLLANLKDEREHGDYEIYSSLDGSDAKLAVKQAKEFISEMERFLAPYLKKK